MNRYFTSFLITGLIYSLLFGFIFYIFIENIIYSDKIEEKVIHKISFSLREEVLEIKKSLEKIKPIVPPKKDPPPIVHKIIKKKIDVPPVKKKVVKKIAPKEVIVPKEVIESIKHEKDLLLARQKEKEAQKIAKNLRLAEKQRKLEELRALENLKEQALYLEKVKERINKNKSYPRVAQKGNIQGSVKVRFIISPKGKLVSYEIMEGKRVFHKSIAKAIERSFPFPVKKEIFSTNLTVKLEVVYKII
jgi:protein TonB